MLILSMQRLFKWAKGSDELFWSDLIEIWLWLYVCICICTHVFLFFLKAIGPNFLPTLARSFLIEFTQMKIKMKWKYIYDLKNPFKRNKPILTSLHKAFVSWWRGLNFWKCSNDRSFLFQKVDDASIFNFM